MVVVCTVKKIRSMEPVAQFAASFIGEARANNPMMKRMMLERIKPAR